MRSKFVWVVAGVLAVFLAGSMLYVTLRNPPSDQPGNGPTGSPTNSPSTEEIKAQVESAYLRYWTVWTEAAEELDPSILDEVMTGPALEKARETIEAARERNDPIRIRVEHNYQILLVPEFATVDDTFVDRSVRLDPETRQPVGPESNETTRNSYTLRKVGDRWKVAEIIGYESSSPQS